MFEMLLSHTMLGNIVENDFLVKYQWDYACNNTNVHISGFSWYIR